MSAEAKERIPLTILAGYLGAGKTTVINHLLAHNDGLRLVNDFGALNIDAGLIAAHDSDTIALTNGCVCCTLADDLGLTLDRLTARQPRADHIVMEASGVAEPAKLAIYGGGWPGLRLDGVVTIADAETLRARAQDKFVGRLVRRQLAAGDLVILNKIDLVGRQERHALQAWLNAEVPGVRAIETCHGAVSAAVMLSTFERPRQSDQAPHDHGDSFSTTVFEAAAPLDRHRLEAWLDDPPAGLLRAKGAVCFAQDPAQPYLLQLVGRRWDLEPMGAPPRTEIALIGLSGVWDKEATHVALSLCGAAPIN